MNAIDVLMAFRNYLIQEEKDKRDEACKMACADNYDHYDASFATGVYTEAKEIRKKLSEFMDKLGGEK